MNSPPQRASIGRPSGRIDFDVALGADFRCRRSEAINGKRDLVVAFRSGHGTEHMVRIA